MVNRVAIIFFLPLWGRAGWGLPTNLGSMARLSIQKVHVGEKDTNCYVVTCSDTKEAVVIDPGDDAPKILNQLRALIVRWIAFTHAHPGHTGAKESVKTATEAPTAMHLAAETA